MSVARQRMVGQDGKVGVIVSVNWPETLEAAKAFLYSPDINPGFFAMYDLTTLRDAVVDRIRQVEEDLRPQLQTGDGYPLIHGELYWAIDNYNFRLLSYDLEQGAPGAHVRFKFPNGTGTYRSPNATYKDRGAVLAAFFAGVKHWSCIKSEYVSGSEKYHCEPCGEWVELNTASDAEMSIVYGVCGKCDRGYWCKRESD